MAPAEPRAASRRGLSRRLGALPETARDTLLVLVVAAMSLAPLLPRMPAWAALLAATWLLWRAALAWSGRRLPSRVLLAALLALCVGGVLAQFHTLFGRDPGVTLVGMLLGLKLLETRLRRDAYVVFYLGLFCVFAQFLYSQSAWAAAWMLLCTLGWLTALLDANLPARRPPLPRRLATSLRLLGLGLPLTAALFVLFPRLAGPLWSLPDSHQAATGLSDDMDPGAIARLALDDSVAFRVHFDGPLPPLRDMYWRGPVLGHFDGVRWTALAQGGAPPKLRGLGERVRYTVILQPTQRHFAFALSAPARAPALQGQPGVQLQLQADLTLRADHRLTRVTRFAATSWLRHAYGAGTSARRLRLLLRLPPGDDPRSVALGRALRERYGAGGAPAVAAAALRMFRDQPFHYSLHPGRYRGPDAVDDFLFRRRIGFCEHYAEAFVVLMRAAGIPARIVTGYQGGSLNPLDGMWVVRQSDAHAWAEYWVRGRGWVRADPTAMVDPARVDRSQTLTSASPLLGLAVLGPRDTRALRWLRNAGDALDAAWNQWVLDYGQTRQQRLIGALGLGRIGRAQLAASTALATVLMLALGGLWLQWRARAARDPWQQAWAVLRWRLRRHGVPSTPGEPPAWLARRLGGQPGMQAVCELLLEMERVRYAAPAAGRGVPRRLLGRALRVRMGRARPPGSSGSTRGS